MACKGLIGFSLIFLYLVFLGVLFPGQSLHLAGLDEGFPSAWPQRSIPAIAREKRLPLPLAGPRLVVDKSEGVLTLYSGDTEIKRYFVAFGPNYLAGDKEVEGDLRTPEGLYHVVGKEIVFLPDPYLGSRWLQLDYPNLEDARRGLARGRISHAEFEAIRTKVEGGRLAPQKTPLGGEIGIHGGHGPGKGLTWTHGCIALTNRDVEELYRYVPVGTPVEILGSRSRQQ